MSWRKQCCFHMLKPLETYIHPKFLNLSRAIAGIFLLYCLLSTSGYNFYIGMSVCTKGPRTSSFALEVQLFTSLISHYHATVLLGAVALCECYSLMFATNSICHVKILLQLQLCIYMIAVSYAYRMLRSQGHTAIINVTSKLKDSTFTITSVAKQ